MNSRFYIVKDQKDLLSGNIIPRKVLNQVGAYGPLFPMGHMIVPKPITKSRELVVNVSPPLSPVFSPVSPMFGSPVAVRRSLYPVASPFLGPPIIKLSEMYRNKEHGKIEIKPDTGDSFTLDIPLKYFRDVISFIHEEAKKPFTPPAPPSSAPGAPSVAPPTPEGEVWFKIIASGNPTTSIKMTRSKLVEIIKKINDNTAWKSISYSDGCYPNCGRLYPMSMLFRNLLNRYPYYRRFY